MLGKLRCMTTVFLTQNNRILMLHRRGGKVASGLWVGSAGGHFAEAELNDARACVLRELHEELGLQPEEIFRLTLNYITLRQTAGEIRQNYYFFADLPENFDRMPESTEGECRWFDYAELASLEMPLTAWHVLQHYIANGMQRDKLYGGITTAETVVFTALPST